MDEQLIYSFIDLLCSVCSETENKPIFEAAIYSGREAVYTDALISTLSLFMKEISSVK